MTRRSDPATRAARCFALARSTTFAGERDSAIARGIAIVEVAGLDLDAFDVPGRDRVERSARPPQPRYDPRTGRPEPIYTSEAGDGFDWAAWQATLDAAIARARHA